jgi:DNA-3-methyladenine glycosylase
VSPLARSFFAQDTREVARALLGMRLVRISDDGARLSGVIVETEAYRPGDSASHGYRRKTERNAAMFGYAGLAYVYFTYGMHDCFNVVTEAEGTPAAVLIRALEPGEGIEQMRVNRNRSSKAKAAIKDVDLCRGPARLCRALQIDRRLNGYDLCQRGSMLFVEQGHAPPADSVYTSPRVGVSGDEQAINVHWRWFIADSPYVSR